MSDNSKIWIERKKEGLALKTRTAPIHQLKTDAKVKASSRIEPMQWASIKALQQMIEMWTKNILVHISKVTDEMTSDWEEKKDMRMNKKKRALSKNEKLVCSKECFHTTWHSAGMP